MTRAWEHDIEAERTSFRRALAVAGFIGEGTTMRGPLSWHSHHGVEATAHIEVTLTDAFPFGPPTVRIIDAGIPLSLTFHRGSDGSLCLWPSDTDVETAPWRDPPLLLRKVAAWLHQTDARWPADSACDLERYLPSDSRLVLYNAEALAATKGCVRTRVAADGRCITITNERRKPPSRMKPARRPNPKAKGYKLARKQQHLAWVADLGHVEQPIEDWASLEVALGDDAGTVGRLISVGCVEFVVARYRRGSAAGLLVMAVRPAPSQGSGGAPVEVHACEAADTSMPTRLLRAGPATSELVDSRVAVVGVSAVGSFVADLLFRHGVRNLTLIDGQKLRPGNVVRHLAGETLVGYPKALAVKSRLQHLGFDTAGIDDRYENLTTPEQGINLVREHDTVVDATADPRAATLLVWASRQHSRPLISVCVEREGAIVRVDRFPLRGTEQHLPPIRAQGGRTTMEHGCDDPVSPTPPTSVVAAAQLASPATIDELTRACTMPPTLLYVIESQDARCELLGKGPPAVADVANPANARPGHDYAAHARSARVIASNALAIACRCHAAR